MLTRSIILPALLSILGLVPAKALEKKRFTHPGVFSTQADLARLKKLVTSDPNTRQGYNELRKSPFADLSRAHTPLGVVRVVASGGNADEKAFRGDAQAAHATALMWVIKGDKRYRDKSIAILNDWARTFKKLEPADPKKSGQIWLEAAWAAPIWTAAADIIRYYDQGAAGWKPQDIAVFDRFLRNMVTTAREARKHNNNWGTSATLAIMAAAVYLEDKSAYAEAKALHKKHLSSISTKEGMLVSDYLRDPWHPQYTILTWIQICEIAWNQGDDLYDQRFGGQSTPRMAVCLEHFAKLFTGALPDPEGLAKGKYLGSHQKRQGYEIAYNHFIKRKDLAESMPTFATMVPDWRPGGNDNHFVGWDSLTHAALDAGR